MPRQKTIVRTRVQSAPKRRQQRQNRAVVTTTTTIQRRRPRPGRFRYVPRGTPAAFSRRLNATWSMYTRGRSTYVTGHDILSLDVDRSAGESGVFWTFPVNPVYWTGTQIAAVASSYMSYRPLRLRIQYKPKVGTSESGSVTFGTCFDKVVTASNLQRTLNASNGGFTTQVYHPSQTTISCGTNLNQNLYNTCGSPDDVDVNPFTMVAYTDCSKSGIPGEFVVYYTYKLTNPGITAVYDNSGYKETPIAKAAGDTVEDYTLEGLSTAINAAITIAKPFTVSGVTYGAGTTFQLAKYGLRWGTSLVATFKQLYDAYVNHQIPGIIYSYVTGGS